MTYEVSVDYGKGEEKVVLESASELAQFLETVPANPDFELHGAAAVTIAEIMPIPDSVIPLFRF